jgi:hypothetical protein
MDTSGRGSEDQNADRNADIKTVLMRYQMGTRTLLGIVLEVIHVTFWKRIFLNFVHALKLCGRLSLKVID